MNVEQLSREILQLPMEDRVMLARRLLATLADDPDLEEAWYSEAERRLGELEAGLVREIPADHVFRALGIARDR